MNGLHGGAFVCVAAWILVSAGCASVEAPPPEPQESLVTESSQVDSSEETAGSFSGLEMLADTEWTGLDHLRDQITFIFHADGRVSYRNALGEFSYDGDSWVVEGDVLTFQADYRGPFGVATHTGQFDQTSGVLQVEYTTTTNRAGSYTLYLLD